MSRKQPRDLLTENPIVKANQNSVHQAAIASNTNVKTNVKGSKFALIHIGTDEVYGLEYVAAELKKHGHQIRWFDGNLDTAVNEVVDWQAGYMCFSPLTTFFPSALEFCRKVKSQRPNIISIFGGHHVTAAPGARVRPLLVGAPGPESRARARRQLDP